MDKPELCPCVCVIRGSKSQWGFKNEKACVDRPHVGTNKQKLLHMWCCAASELVDSEVFRFPSQCLWMLGTCGWLFEACTGREAHPFSLAHGAYDAESLKKEAQ